MEAGLAHEDRPGHLLIFDIDHFKILNDTYGHPFGDEVLRRLGRVLAETLPEGSLISRLGGEEFVVFCERGGVEEAERCRRVIEALAWGDDVPELVVTISAGVCRYDGDLSTAYPMADAALYRAKSLGRNRVESEKSSSSQV